MECNIRNIFRGLVFMLFVLSIKSDPKPAKLSFRPSHYKLEIFTEEKHFKPSNENLKYRGVVTVTFKPSQAPSEDFKIELNSDKDTIVSKVQLLLEGGEAKDLNFESKEDKLIITCRKEHASLPQFVVRVEFTNPFRNDMTGFYRSSYKQGTETKWLLTTHFEPIFARKAFPCFDEPHLKATFKVSLQVPKNIKTVLSNTPLEGSSVVEGQSKIYVFEETPCKMSTYLVAFTASEFEATNKETFGGGKELKTYGRKDVIDRKEGELAQTVGKQAVEELAAYLAVQYAFKKIDQIGIPDFSAGAMENWGHISFREKSLFYNKDRSSIITKQSNLLTITHELVHQWFGNLVTLHSWNYIWLNEAFATYFEYIIANKIEESKDWNLLNQLVVNEIHLRAFETDGLSSSTPLNYEIPSESQIFSSFNDIPYSKGAAVLRMWHSILGYEFQENIKEYLKQSKESTVTPEKLFEFLKNGGLTETDFYSWTNQTGYPVVEVKKANGKYYLTQERFLWEKPDNPPKEKWRVPITFVTSNFPEPKPLTYLEKDKNMTIEGNFKWIIVNYGQEGYYRVNYDKENWNALKDALLKPEWSQIRELNRAQIINDVFSLARSLQSDYVEYSTALNLAAYLKNETAFVPWKTALTAFDFLQTKAYGEKFTEKFKNYIFSLILPHYKGLRPEGLNHVQTLMNIEISHWACSLGHKPCVDEAVGLFKNGTYNQYPNTQEISLCTAVRHDDKAWEEVHKLYRAEEDSGLRIMYISALGCTIDEKRVQSLLNFTLRDPPTIPKQDLTYVLSAVYNGNLKNVEPAFKFIQENYQKIAKTYGGINPLGKALIGIARKLKTEDQLKKMQVLVGRIKENKELSASHESAASALNIAQSNINWVKRRMEQMNKYFNSGSLLSYSLALLSACLLFVVEF